MKNYPSNDRERIFSRALKEELFQQDSTCSICNQRIVLINDAAIDHIDHYWRGGVTIPENARLVHRTCNLARSHTH
jgi:5-methylcytosine-specific restriction endonuclease McrA